MMSDKPEMIKHQKPAAFYPEFFRKGPGQVTTHYCPGCGHGNAHKLIAEAIGDLGIQDRVIFCSPVGCSVFAYYYFDCGNIQCAHGRAPAVATGIRRTLDHAIIICYQGDGDLAGIGMGAIVHAANRGENITVFFVNNAIYGMTGGQMAPTTLIGQKTLTSPAGRSAANEGHPICMAELINTLKAPVFIERVSFGTIAGIMKARQVFRKALENQVQRKGFSFVEVLSPCPVNWKMSPTGAREWLVENLEPAFPVRNLRDESASRLSIVHENARELTDSEYFVLLDADQETGGEVSAQRSSIDDQYVKIAGFGGQGVLSAGMLLANCGVAEGLNTAWLPSYGPEMRGGTANASVIISSGAIGSPVVDNPNVMIAMNLPSLDAFEDQVLEGGLIIVNSSIINRKVKRKDVRAVYVPASDIAKDAGLVATAGVVLLTIYALISRIISADTLRRIIPASIKKKEFIAVNLKAIDAGLAFYGAAEPQEK